MAAKTDIWVYAHWQGMSDPICLGLFSAHQGKGRQAFSFSYDPAWLASTERRLLDPDLDWYAGPQFPVDKENFGMILDSMPDRWGRTLLTRRAALEAHHQETPFQNLQEIDFLLGVLDQTRMGALRFKRDPDGPFLDNHPGRPVPPLSSIRTLQQASTMLESEQNEQALQKWLSILVAPGSSLGGARPKANVLDPDGHLWIAKFPSKNDSVDIGAWEYLAYQLATKAGISMAPSRILQVSGNFHTFLSKRFDRQANERIHFASAMTLTGNTEDTLKTAPAGYLDLAEFIQFNGGSVETDLHQLWRRIAFNILISNTDDHLRNHGFLLQPNGWHLSPAFDINPSIDKAGLALNIDAHNNALDIELAKSVGAYFQLSSPQMKTILDELYDAVKQWPVIASHIGIPRSEQLLMAPAFRI